MEKIWSDKYEEFGGCCAYCGTPLLVDVDSFMCGQLDHLVPTKSGGPDTPKNKVLACFVCNNLKGNFDPRSAGSTDKEKMIDTARAFIFTRRAEKAKDLLGYRAELIKRAMRRASPLKDTSSPADQSSREGWSSIPPAP
jgi:HNH endonuclease